MSISPNCQLHAAVYLGRGERDQVSKTIRDRDGILQYLVVQLSGSRRRVDKIIEKVNNLNFKVRYIVFSKSYNEYLPKLRHLSIVSGNTVCEIWEEHQIDRCN